MIISEISGQISPVQWAHQIMLMYPPATTVSFWHVSSTSRAALELCGLGITDGSGRKEGAESTDSSWVLEDRHLPISERSYWVDKPLITEGGVLFFLIFVDPEGAVFLMQYHESGYILSNIFLFGLLIFLLIFYLFITYFYPLECKFHKDNDLTVSLSSLESQILEYCMAYINGSTDTYWLS